MMLESIVICAATNDHYAKPLGVMLHSLLSNTAHARNVVIYLLESDLSDRNKTNLEAIVASYQATISFITIAPALFDGLKEKTYITRETYYRLAIPKLLHKDISKVLYLDCDLIVMKDIAKLWNTDLEGFCLGAVEKKDISDKRKKALGIPAKAPYFNAGVLLMNLALWRKLGIAEQILEYCRTHADSIKLCSQDPMNAVLQGKWMKLHRKWNFLTSYVLLYPETEPSIIHFTGREKPWSHEHFYREEYFKYLNSMPWAEL